MSPRRQSRTGHASASAGHGLAAPGPDTPGFDGQGRAAFYYEGEPVTPFFASGPSMRQEQPRCRHGRPADRCHLWAVERWHRCPRPDELEHEPEGAS